MSGNPETADEAIQAARRESAAVPYGILIVDDEPAILESIELTLGGDYRVFTAESGLRGLEILEREEIALIISDQVLPEISGVEFLERSIEIEPRAIRILLTGYADIGSLTRAVNEGRIYRYIAKPWEPDEIRLTVKRALETYELADALEKANAKLRAENLYLRREVERRYSFDQIIGSSPVMQEMFDMMEKVAQTDATVLINGETGTGKDLVARALHYTGDRKDARFVAQNCAALPDTLLESELFGHRRGAFTGAHADKKGMFETAHGGTIFLDEVGETHPGMQVRLLRVLQDGEIRPLGSSDTKNVDVRIIAATNRDLRKEVEEGRFREDLYYRLRVVEITMPPLRERAVDVPALAHHFLDQVNRKMKREVKGFTNAAMDCLVRYGWPGNVRELENEIERTLALAGGVETISEEMLSEYIRDTPARRGDGSGRGSAAGSSAATFSRSGSSLDPSTAGMGLNEAVDALKEQMILEAIESTGSKTRAAEKLGIPRQSLQKMMKRLNLP